MNKRLISLTACVALLAEPGTLAAKSAGTAVPDRMEAKIRLMEQALSARDRGDYPAAVSTLEELIAKYPGDPQLRLLLDQVRLAAARPREEKPAPPPVVLPDPRLEPVLPPSLPTSTPVATESPASTTPKRVEPTPPPPPSESLLIRPAAPRPAETDLPALVKLETDRQTYFMAQARRDLWYVRTLSDEGRHAEALASMAKVGAELPVNPRTLSLVQEIAATRVDLEHRLRVSKLNPGAEPPRLSLTKDDIASVAKSTDPLSKRSVTLELQMLELSGDLMDDFWTAWRFFCEGTEWQGPARLHQSILGRTSSLYRPGQSPTSRQQELLWALRLAAPRAFDSRPLSYRDRSLGFVAFLDAGAIVRILSSMQGCRVLGSPRWESYSGQGASLEFATEENSPSASASTPALGWQLRVVPQLVDSGRSVRLDLQPRLSRYAGFVPDASTAKASGDSNALASVFSTQQLQARVHVPIGGTFVMTGLQWQQSPLKVPSQGSPQHIPLLGSVLRAQEMMAERSELLLLLTTKLDVQ